MVTLDWSKLYAIVDHVSTIGAIPLAIVGFWIAMAQINKTKKAAIAARDAARDTAVDVSRSNVLTLIPELHKIEEELDRAIEGSSLQLFFSWSNTWRRQAGRLRGHLQVLGDKENDLSQLIQSSISAVAIVKDQISIAGTDDIAKSTRKVRQKISAVTNELGALEAMYGTQQKGGTIVQRRDAQPLAGDSEPPVIPDKGGRDELGKPKP